MHDDRAVALVNIGADVRAVRGEIAHNFLNCFRKIAGERRLVGHNPVVVEIPDHGPSPRPALFTQLLAQGLAGNEREGGEIGGGGWRWRAR